MNTTDEMENDIPGVEESIVEVGNFGRSCSSWVVVEHRLRKVKDLAGSCGATKKASEGLLEGNRIDRGVGEF